MKTTTKIVGAVLGVLLVAALFTGAVAADPATDNATNLGNKEVWVLYDLDADFIEDDGAGGTQAVFDDPDEFLNAEWENAFGDVIKFRSNGAAAPLYYLAGNDIVEGKYFYTKVTTKEVYFINVKYPGAAAITGSVMEKPAAGPAVAVANLAGANVDVEKFYVQLDGFSLLTATEYIAWTNPDGTLTTVNPENFGIYYLNSKGKMSFKGNDGTKDVSVKTLGEYTIQKVIALNAGAQTAGNYVSIAPFPLLGAPTTFTLYNSKDSMTLTALSDEVIQGNYVTVELTAPYGKYTATVTEGSIPAGQVGAKSGNQGIEVGLDGVKTFVVKSDSANDIKVTVSGNGLEKSVTIKVVPGKISAEAIPAITNIGNEIDIIGTNELGDELILFMKGENYFKEIAVDNNSALTPTKAFALDKGINGKEFAVTLKTGKLGADAGYYTLYLAKLHGNTTPGQITKIEDFAESDKCDAYTTIAIKLVPSFISITEMPTYAVIGEDFVVKGTAEGHPNQVMWYVFGNNYYNVGKASVEDDNSFEITIKPAETTTKMEAGQYFLVIQHPMYNGQFNVGPKNLEADKATILVNKMYDVGDTTTAGAAALSIKLFTVDLRQTTNAAYALCRAIDGDEDIDDMYVKRSFTVVEASSVINAIPAQVAQGDALVISGTARGYKNAAVAVTISTGGVFDATSKNDSGNATGSFAEVTSVAADGSWSVSFDTANIPVGEYKVTAKVGTASTSEAKDLKVVQGSAGPQPTSTEQPTAQPTSQPTQTPASPGFGILAALAGLGAVAVLLLRRQ